MKTINITITLVITILFLIFMVDHTNGQETALIPFDDLEIIDTNNASAISEITMDADFVRDVSVSPNGSMIAIARQQGDSDYSIVIYDIESTEPVSYMRGRMDLFRDIVWSPDSEHIAVISGRTTGGGVVEQSVKTYTITSGADEGLYILGNSDTWYVNYFDRTSDTDIMPVLVVWNPTSDMIAVAFHEHLEVYDAESNSELFTTSVTGIVNLEWVIDGSLIIVEDYTRHIRLLAVVE